LFNLFLDRHLGYFTSLNNDLLRKRFCYFGLIRIKVNCWDALPIPSVVVK
jgi:hypothetical protein